MKTYTNNSPGLRGITVNGDGGPSIKYLEPGESVELDPALVIAVPDLGAASAAPALADGNASLHETIAELRVENERLEEAKGTIRSEVIKEAQAEIGNLTKAHDAALSAETQRADDAEKEVADLKRHISDMEKAAAERGADPELIKAAVDGLDPKNDEHWTAAGLPEVKAVKAALGADVTRAQIEAAAPEAKRPAA